MLHVYPFDKIKINALTPIFDIRMNIVSITSNCPRSLSHLGNSIKENINL